MVDLSVGKNLAAWKTSPRPNRQMRMALHSKVIFESFQTISAFHKGDYH